MIIYYILVCVLLRVALMFSRFHPMSVKAGEDVSAHTVAHRERTHAHTGPKVGTRDCMSCVLHGIPSHAHKTSLFGIA
jgi:hypothetical protein